MLPEIMTNAAARVARFDILKFMECLLVHFLMEANIAVIYSETYREICHG
tara:strand:- start:2576 stop:2725 length:150 start_codon:yes stop_codon:yes gene_type:complete